MEKSVLDGCGRYSEKLIEISEVIIGQKMKNGEMPSKNDVWKIDSQIFEAYQTILANAKDSNIIARSIEHLKDSVEKSKSISDLNGLAITSVQKSIEENRYAMRVNEDESSNVFATAATAVIATDVVQEGMKILDNIFDENTLKEIDAQLEKAKNGDEKVAGGMDVYEKAMTFFAKNPVLNENSQRGALAWMKRLEDVNSPLAEKLIKDMALQYKFDIFEKTEDGEFVISKEKIDKLYEDKISEVNPEMAKKGNEHFTKLNEKAGKKAIEEGKFESKTSEDFEKQVRKRVEDPKRAYLDELIEKYNNMQQKGASQESLLETQRKISVMNEVVRQKEEKGKNVGQDRKNKEENEEFVLE